MVEGPTRFPLAWPVGRPRKTAAERRAGRFGTTGRSAGNASLKPLTVSEAFERLAGELHAIGASSTLLSSDVELRIDGRPRFGREPDDPGMALYLERRGQLHLMMCDTYDKVVDNVAALAAHLAATRAIERHGVATLADMLAGFVALPAPRAGAGAQPLLLPHDRSWCRPRRPPSASGSTRGTSRPTRRRACSASPWAPSTAPCPTSPDAASPSADPTTGNFDRKAIEAWMDLRSGLASAPEAQDAGVGFGARPGAIRGRGKRR